MSQVITRSEVLAAQKAWADALLKISADYKTGGKEKAKATATFLSWLKKMVSG
jgi:hypothetical protein